MKTTLTISAFLLAALPLGALAQTGDAAPAAQEKPAGQPMQEEATPASSDVARAVFTTGIADHEPIDDLEAYSADLERVYFFTEIVDREGQTLNHRWLLDGEPVAEVPIEVGGPRWRAWSEKTIGPDENGTWTVQVVTADGTVLDEETLGTAQQEASSHSGDAASGR